MKPLPGVSGVDATRQLVSPQRGGELHPRRLKGDAAVLDAVLHLHRNLLPLEEAQVSLLQQGLQFDIRNSTDYGHDSLLQLDQIFNVVFHTVI